MCGLPQRNGFNKHYICRALSRDIMEQFLPTDKQDVENLTVCKE